MHRSRNYDSNFKPPFNVEDGSIILQSDTAVHVYRN